MRGRQATGVPYSFQDTAAVHRLEGNICTLNLHLSLFADFGFNPQFDSGTITLSSG
jgi:hypothetical protein